MYPYMYGQIHIWRQSEERGKGRKGSDREKKGVRFKVREKRTEGE